MVNLTLKRAVAIALLAGASVAANAATQDAGTVQFGVPSTFNGVVLGNTSTGLNDIITFTPAAPAVSAGFSVIDFPIDLGSIGSLKLDLATVTLSSVGADGLVGVAMTKC